MTPTPQLSLGLLLTAAAGCIDAVGFIELGGYYTSFMSGNTTQLGQALSEGIWPVARLTASLVALFLLGSVLGTLLASIGNRWGAASATALAFLAVLATLLLAATGFPPTQSMLVLAAAAGAQNAILPSTGSVRLGTTFVTGTLFTTGADLARALRRQAPPWRWAQHLLVWASLLLGALIGGFGYRMVGVTVLAAPALVYAGFMVIFLVRRPASLVT